MNDMTELYGEFGDDICILIGGDFNARTSDKHDYVMHDNEDHLPLPCDYRIDNAVNPRVSRDKKKQFAWWFFIGSVQVITIKNS